MVSMQRRNLCDDSEILVHVSAPAGRRDDINYLARVEAIQFDFEAVSRQCITLGDPDDDVPVIGSPEESRLEPTGQQSKGLHSTRNADSFTSPTGVIPDSYSDHGNSNNVASPIISRSDHRDQHGASYACGRSPAVEAAAAEEEEDDGAAFTSQLLRMVSKGPMQSGGDDDSTIYTTKGQVDPIHTPPPLRSSLLTCSSTGQGHITSQEDIHNGSSRNNNDEQQSSIPIEQPQQNNSHNGNDILNSLPLQIHPPPPPVSTDTFTSHITPTLEMLAIRLKPSRTYKPVRQTRRLHRLERGYWSLRINLLISCLGQENDDVQFADDDGDEANTWNMSFFHRFRTFLSAFISGEARAGWGVWAILEQENEADHGQQLPEERKAYTTPLLLKVYAWGEVAVHIYLLLFLASERRIRGMRAQWRDACEDVVIQMP